MKKILITLLVQFNFFVGFSQITGDISQPTTCSSTDGNIYLSVKWGSPPYAFNWNNGATSADLTNIKAGKYCVTVSDAFCCEATACFDLEPPISALEEKPYIKDIEVIFRGATIYKGTWAFDASIGCVRFSEQRNPYQYQGSVDKFDVVVTFNKPMNIANN